MKSDQSNVELEESRKMFGRNSNFVVLERQLAYYAKEVRCDWAATCCIDDKSISRPVVACLPSGMKFFLKTPDFWRN